MNKGARTQAEAKNMKIRRESEKKESKVRDVERERA